MMVSCRVARARLVLALVGLAVTAAALACGTPERRDGQRFVRRGEDLVAAGETLRVADSVPGDVMLAGGEVAFTGATGGDYLGAGGEQAIAGRIHGSARVAGGEVRLSAPVARNATIAGGRIELDRNAVVERSAYLAGGEVRADALVRRGLYIAAGTAALDGEVGGNVEVNAGALRIGPSAVVAGDLRYRVPAERVHIDSGARIGGRVTALQPRNWRAVARAFRLMWLLGFLIAGVVAVAVAPRLADAAADRLGARPGLSAIIGCVWLIVVPVVATLVAMTVIGIPLALLVGAVYVVLAFVGGVVLALWLGRLVLGAHAPAETLGAVLSFLVGAIILIVLSLLPLLGPFVMLVAIVLGLGALLIELRSWSRAPLAG